MKRVLSAFMATALMLVPVFAEEVTLPSDDDVKKILTDRIDGSQTGIVVALIENGRSRFVSHGQFGRNDPRQVDENTLFEAGSITKVFTNLLLAQLVLDGRIDLNAPIANYLPANIVLPTYKGKAITAFDLATHTSGLPSLPDDLMTADINNPYTGYGSQGLFNWLATYRLNRPIGKDFSYSNAGTALLGLVITHIDGRSYTRMVQQEILDPLGMKQSVLALTGNTRPDMATGHGRGGEPVSHWDFDAFAPAGALITSAGDLAKFIAAASGQTETPLKPAFALLTEHSRPAGGKTRKIGLGPVISKLARRTIVWHNGRTGGFESFAGFDRENGNGVIVLSNRLSITGIDDIGAHLLDARQELLPQPPIRIAVAIDTAKLPAYVGQYLLAPGAIMSITEEKGQLFLQLTGQQRFAAYPESDTKFFLREVDAQISFTVEDGKATKLTLHQNGRNMPALRVGD